MPHVWRLLQEIAFHLRLQRRDEEVARDRRAQGCGRCGGKLHQAHYPREPRGGPGGLGAAYNRRFSFCCASCRARTTPPSLRFGGRKVYLAAVVMLLPAAAQRSSRSALHRLRKALGPSARTLARWIAWWSGTVPGTSFWKEARAHLMPPIEPAALPGGLLERFTGDDSALVERALVFVSPLSTVTS